MRNSTHILRNRTSPWTVCGLLATRSITLIYMFICMFLQPPEPADPWNGTLDATKFGKKCPALKRTDEEADFKKWTSLFSVEGTEDCLSLNVYTPQVNEVEPLFRAQYYWRRKQFNFQRVFLQVKFRILFPQFFFQNVMKQINNIPFRICYLQFSFSASPLEQ